MKQILRLFIALFYFPLFGIVFTLLCICHCIGIGLMCFDNKIMWFADNVLNPINEKYEYLT